MTLIKFREEYPGPYGDNFKKGSIYKVPEKRDAMEFSICTGHGQYTYIPCECVWILKHKRCEKCGQPIPGKYVEVG